MRRVIVLGLAVFWAGCTIIEKAPAKDADSLTVDVLEDVPAAGEDTPVLEDGAEAPGEETAEAAPDATPTEDTSKAELPEEEPACTSPCMSAEIGPDGGTFESDGWKLIVPPGAVSETVTITVETQPTLDVAGDALPSPGAGVILALSPSGLVFDVPIQIRVPAALLGETPVVMTDYAFIGLSDAGLVLTDGFVVDSADADGVTVSVPHFSWGWLAKVQEIGMGGVAFWLEKLVDGIEKPGGGHDCDKVLGLISGFAGATTFFALAGGLTLGDAYLYERWLYTGGDIEDFDPDKIPGDKTGPMGEVRTKVTDSMMCCPDGEAADIPQTSATGNTTTGGGYWSADYQMVSNYTLSLMEAKLSCSGAPLDETRKAIVDQRKWRITDRIDWDKGKVFDVFGVALQDSWFDAVKGCTGGKLGHDFDLKTELFTDEDVTWKKTLPGNQVLSGDSCICVPGTGLVMEDGECACPPEQEWDIDSETCLCPDDKEWSVEKEECVCADEPTTPGETQLGSCSYPPVPLEGHLVGCVSYFTLEGPFAPPELMTNCPSWSGCPCPTEGQLGICQMWFEDIDGNTTGHYADHVYPKETWTASEAKAQCEMWDPDGSSVKWTPL